MMRNAALIGATVAALSLAAVPATAQISVQVHRDDAGWDGGRDNRNVGYGYDEGYRRGEREGQHDARDRKDYGYKRDDAYEDADEGYRGWGSKDAYRHDFRRGYEVGYDRGYRSVGFGIRVEGGGSANEYGPYGYPERGYGAYADWGYRNGGGSAFHVAFDFGRRDGYDAGIQAARHGHYQLDRERYYRSTRGWEHRYGDRDAYDVSYRNGFRSGYDEGFRVGGR